MNRRPEDLQEQIEALRNKTDQNRKMAQEANKLADDALKHVNESAQVSLKGHPVTSKQPQDFRVLSWIKAQVTFLKSDYSLSRSTCKTWLLQQHRALNSLEV